MIIVLWIICTIVNLIAAPEQNFWANVGFGLLAALVLRLFLAAINWYMSHYKPLGG